MRRAFAPALAPALALALAVLCGAAQGQSIVGDWSCVTQSNASTFGQAQTQGRVRFSSKKTAQSQMRMDIFDRKKRKIAVAEFIYQSRYKLEGNKLYDYPVAAKVISLKAGKHDLTQSAPARQLRNGLMRKQKAPSTVAFPSAGRLVISPAGKGPRVTCKRLR